MAIIIIIIIISLSNIPGKHEIKELQKTAILDTAHILRKVLTLKSKTFNRGSNNNIPLIVTIEQLQQYIS